MPLAPTGTRGYADSQRVSNYDTGVLWNLSTGPNTTDWVSPVLDVSRFAYLGMNIAALLGQPQVNLAWYLDAQATIACGTRVFALDTNISGNAHARILNLGPFVQITIARVTAPQYYLQIQAYATNRVYPFEFIPTNPVILSQQNVAIGAGINANVYPVDYYAGPVNVWFDAAYANGGVSLQYLNQSGTWEFNDERVTTAVGVYTYQMVTPPGAWRLVVGNNTGGASSYYLVVTPSLTGST